MTGGNAASEEEAIVSVAGCDKRYAADNKRTRIEHSASPCTLSLTTKFEDRKNLAIK